MVLLGCAVFPCNAWDVSTCIESSAVNNRLQIAAVFQPVSSSYNLSSDAYPQNTPFSHFSSSRCESHLIHIKCFSGLFCSSTPPHQLN